MKAILVNAKPLKILSIKPVLSFKFQIICLTTGAQPEIFQGRGGFVKLGHFDKHFIKKSRKTAPQGKILEFSHLDTLKTTF